ncbi:MAG: SWIM zinc finger family protein [Chloroflexi bacterium]|nr:SWIM zinc finger family protein [Chloroflexota bacterium]
MGWYDWQHYTPGPPRAVKNGIKTRSQRGAIGETWWSKRWINVLERLGMGARLDRGRSYARRGQVVSIDIQKGVVKSKVQGTQVKPYSITIRLSPFSDQEWDKVAGAMAAQAIFAAKLLAGEMPQNIEDAFTGVKVPLFPTSIKHLDTECSCPDWANPCKHIAAVYYILAERFDEDPFLIFTLRGRTKEEIIRVLRDKRGKTLAVEEAAPAGPEVAIPESPAIRLEDCMETFWKAGQALESFVTGPAPPEVDNAILKRLGKPPFAEGAGDVLSRLERAYAAASQAALQRAAGKPDRGVR